ncbi:MAG: hypothetical protein RLY93_06535 [Sumerlaeia bacterium]
MARPSSHRTSFPLAGLFWLDFLRLVRGWRWRAVMGVAMVGSYLLDRFAGDFGPGASVAFPGGQAGLWAAGLFLGLGAMVVAVDLCGQDDRYRAAQMAEALPRPVASLQVGRFLALWVAMALPGAFVCAWPWISHPLSALSASHGIDPAPSWAFWGAILLPLLAFGCAAGMAARGLLRNEASAVLLGGVLVAPGLWAAYGVGDPAEIFLTASRSLGLLVPGSVLVDQALGLLSLAALLLAGAVGAMAHRPRRWRVLGRPGWPLATAGVFAVMLLVGLPGARWIATVRPVPTMEADWQAAREPAGAGGVVLPPRILARRLTIAPAGEGADVLAEFDLAAVLSEPQGLAALTFGPALEVFSAERDGGAVARLAPHASAGLPGSAVFQFQPPLDPASTTTLRVRLRVAPNAERLWAKTTHPAYARFDGAPFWFGAGLSLNYSFADWSISPQPAPFGLELPDLGERRWVAGSAVEAPGAAPGRVRLVQPRSALPDALFAAELYESRATHAGLELRFLVLPEHRALADAFQVIWARRFERIARVFDAAEAPLPLLTYYETPQQDPANPMAMPSALLDRLGAELADYDDFEDPTAPIFDEALIPLHAGAVAQLWSGAFASFEHPELMRDALAAYLHEFGLASGQTRRITRLRREFVLVPWDLARQPNQYPFDLMPRDEAGWRGALFAGARDRAAPPPDPRRAVAFHHMLRGLIGEEAFLRTLHTLLSDRAGQRLRLEDYRHAAEAAHGEGLGWFFDQWLREGVVPELRLVEAQVVLAENPNSRNLEYTTKVVFENIGNGRVPVPVVLQTESDQVTEQVTITPGERRDLTFVTRDRPLAVVLDPLGWVAQMPPFNEAAKRPIHPQIFLKTVKEL